MPAAGGEAMNLYAACNGSGGQYDPAEAYLYEWFKTEVEAIRYFKNKLGSRGCVFHIHFDCMDHDGAIALIEQNYLDKGLATIEVIYPDV